MTEINFNGKDIKTFSGEYIDIFSDDIENRIRIDDIAHALSLMCRFGGHIKSFYSVAEHSIWVAKRLPNEHKLAGLLHDASEAYLVDIPTPIKKRFPFYIDIEDKMMKIISKKFNFQYPFSKEVKFIDLLALKYEWESFTVNETKKTKFNPQVVEKKFIELFYRYSNM